MLKMLSIMIGVNSNMIYLVFIYVAVCIFMILNLKKKKLRYKTLFKCVLSTSSAMLIVCLIIIVIALRHGADLDALKSLNMISMVRAIMESPVASDSEELDKEGNFIIYYRFGCHDCEAIYKDLLEMVEDVPNVYWVSTRKNNGMELLCKYKVAEVPSGIIIEMDSDYTSYELCRNGAIDKDAIDRLLELQKVALQ